MEKKIELQQAWLPVGLFWTAMLLAGAFHEYIACFFAAASVVLLTVYGIRNRQLTVYFGFTAVTVLVITLCYGLSVFWAVDSGMAFIGFLKMLAAPLFVLLLLQYRQGRQLLLDSLPVGMAVLTVLTLIAMAIPALQPYVTVADRLAGTLQYPNTFALLLLVAQLLLWKKKFSVFHCALLVILLGGLLATGSRTVFVLAVLSNLAMGLSKGSKKTRIITVAGVAGGTALVLLIAQLSGWNVLERFLRFSLQESTFAGRLLYVRDSLPLILQHPFGLGAWGYSYIQQSVQTGVYATVYAHNELVQLLLDVGWVGAALALVAIGKVVLGKQTDPGMRIVLVTVLLHCCFDFDLQFACVGVLLICLLEPEQGKSRVFRWKGAHTAVAGALCIVFVYMGVALWLPLLGQPQAARTLYPYNTQNNITLLINTPQEQQPALAQQILEQNEYVNVAYTVMANQAYTAGDFTQMIRYKNEIFQKFPFQYAEYEQYCQMLITGIQLYGQAGDTASVDFCRQELIKTAAAVQGQADRLSPLGKMIVDQPTTQLPAELEAYIQALQPEQ